MPQQYTDYKQLNFRQNAASQTHNMNIPSFLTVVNVICLYCYSVNLKAGYLTALIL